MGKLMAGIRGLMRHPGGLLLVAAMALLVSNGRWAWAPAAWLAPLLLLRYTRQAGRPVIGFAAAFAVLWITWLISWFGLMPFPPLIFVRISLTSVLLALLPFAVDRLLAPRFRGGTSTLVFPAAAVGVAYLNSVSAFSTWGVISYTQASFLPILQLASVFGIWGIAFLIHWNASIWNWIWERRKLEKPLRGWAVAYGLVWATVLFFGLFRLGAVQETGTVAVATTNPMELLGRVTEEQMQTLQAHYMGQEVDPAVLSEVQESLSESNRELLERTRQSIPGDVQFFFWPEASLFAFSRGEEERLLRAARDLAREKGVYLGVSVGLIRAEGPNENKILLVDPRGEIIEEYHKTNLVPLVEEPFTRQGTGEIRPVLVEGARVGTVICYDMDNPWFLAEAGRKQIDILFAPSGDWEAIRDIHHGMAVFRAVEQGFNLVRPANHGLSAVVDYRGRVLAKMDHFQETDGILTGRVPAEGTDTVYSRIGDIFPLLSLVLLGILTVTPLVRFLFPGRCRPAGAREISREPGYTHP